MELLKNKNYILIIIVCLLLLIPILSVGSYGRPVADDYDYGILTHEVIQNGGNLFDLIMAAVQTDMNFFNTWSGLYTSSFIQSLQPGIFGESFYGLTCIIVLTIAFICLFFSMKILNKHYIKESNIFIFTYTLVILTIITVLLPSTTEGLFWYNGAMNYMPWVFSNFLGICILIEIFYTDYESRKYFSLLCFSILLSFFTSGGNHVTGVANILIMLMLTIFLIYKKEKYFSVLPLILAIFGFFIVYSAPGTIIRRGYFEPVSFVDTLSNTVQYMFNTVLFWFDYKWLLSLIMITPLSLLISKNIKDKIYIFVPIISIICSLVIIGAMVATPYYAMGEFGAPRVVNVIYITFMISSWVNYTLIISVLEKRNIINFDITNKSYKNMFVLILIISFILLFVLPQGETYSNTWVCLDELNNGVAEKYAIEVDDRLNLIKMSNEENIKVKPITQLSILPLHELNKEPDKWPNTSFAKYYHKNGISLEE